MFFLIIPHTTGISVSLLQLLTFLGLKTIFKIFKYLKQMLMKPQDKMIEILQKSHLFFTIFTSVK